MSDEGLIRPATASIAVVVSVLVLSGIPPGAAATSDSPTVHVDAPVTVSTSTSAAAEVTIDDGELVLSGTATDPDGISHLTIAREFEYDDGGGTEVDRYYATPAASNGTFSHAVPLGAGANEINLSVVDGAGYPTHINLVVHVNDTKPPTTTRLTATPDGKWVRLEGWVSDNVQVDTVRAAGQTIQIQSGGRDLDREAVRLDHRVPRPGGGSVTVTIIDQAGNSREVVVPIGDGRAATPTATPTETPTATATQTASTAAPAAPAATPTATAAETPGPTPPPVTTPTATPEGGRSSLLGLVGVVIVVGGGLLMLNAGGGW